MGRFGHIILYFNFGSSEDFSFVFVSYELPSRIQIACVNLSKQLGLRTGYTSQVQQWLVKFVLNHYGANHGQVWAICTSEYHVSTSNWLFSSEQEVNRWYYEYTDAAVHGD